MSGSLFGGGQNLTALYLTNPELASALRNQSISQSLIQQGTSYEPIRSPWQAMSRIAQALLGGYMDRETGQEIQAASDKSDQQVRDAIARQGGIMGAALSNPGQPLPTGQAPPTTAPANPPTPSDYSLGASVRKIEGDNPAAMNSGGYAGKYQFGTAALQNAGIYQPADGEDLSKNQWKGKIVIAPYKPMTIDEFRANPQAQDAAWEYQKAALGKEIEARGLGKYVGQTIGGVPITTDSLIGMMHFAGPAGTQRFLESGGVYNPRDANGTSVTAYGQRVAPPSDGRVQVAGPGAPTGNPPAAYPSTGPGAPPPAPGATPPTGMQAPSVQRGLALMQEAQANMATRNPRLVAIGQAQMQMAQQLMQLDSYQTLPNGTQISTRTGQVVSAATPAPRYVAGTGPSGVPGQYEINSGKFEAAPSDRLTVLPNGQVINSHGQPVANVPPYKVGPNPVSKENEFVPQYPGYPVLPMSGAPGVATGSPRGAEVKQEADTKQIEADTKDATERMTAAMNGANTLGTTATIRAMLPQVTTGAAAEQRLAGARVLSALGFSDKEVQSMTGTNTPMGELLQKKLFELSTGAVRGMGAREPGSVLQMFQKNYPNMTSRDLTIDSMTRLLDMDQVWKQDEAAARLAHINQQKEGLPSGGQYRGLTGYTPPDPRVYQAAALAAGGMSWDVAGKGLTQQQQAQAAQLVKRIYPDFVPKGYQQVQQ